MFTMKTPFKIEEIIDDLIEGRIPDNAIITKVRLKLKPKG